MLIAQSVELAGRHSQLVAATSLRVAAGEVLVVQAEPQLSRTALSLMLSGRMKPDAGSIEWDAAASMKSLRLASALVDSPEINAPEQHLKVRDLVAEDLSLLPVPLWRRKSIKTWLNRHGFSEAADEWVDALDPLLRLEIMSRLAAEHGDVKLAVFDSPDRHSIPDEQWLELLERIAASRRHCAVIAVVSRIPDSWIGPTAVLGDANAHLFPSSAPEHEPEAHAETSALPITPDPDIYTDESTDFPPDTAEETTAATTAKELS